MDRHYHHHHHHQHQHQRQHNPEFMESNRYHPNHPPPPPPPPHRHLPPPPQQPSLSYRPPPSVPCILHRPPPSPPSVCHHERHHNHGFHQQHIDRRQFLVDGDLDKFRPPFDFPPSPRVSSDRVVFSDHYHGDVDRDRFGSRLCELPRVPPVDGGLDWDHHSPFQEIDRFRCDVVENPSRFRGDLRIDPRLQMRPEVDNRRTMGDVERDRLEANRHEQYHPEVLLRGFELNSGNNGRARVPMADEVPIRGFRDDIRRDRDENVSIRRGGPRDVSRSPMKFRNRGIDIDEGFPGFYEECGSEVGRYSDRGRRDHEMQDHGLTPRKNSQKKSAFLRIQPGKSSSSRNTYNTTNSPHKGKEALQVLDSRFSGAREGSPVELDVSFKSNALVAKAIMAGPSSSAVNPSENSAVGDLYTRIDSESPSKVECVKNCENSSFISKMDKRHSENKVRTSPTMKRVSPLGNAELNGSNSESFSSDSSAFSGGITPPKGKIIAKDDSNTCSNELSSPNARKKRKSIITLSRLSSLVITKKDVDSPVDHPSLSSSSDKCIKKSGTSGDKVIGSAQNDIIVDVGKSDINESPISVVEEEFVGHSINEASCPERMRKRDRSGSLPDIREILGPMDSHGAENTNGCLQDAQKISNLVKDVTKSIEECSSDTGSMCCSINGQDMAPLLTDNGSVERSSEPMVIVEENVDNIDIHRGHNFIHSPIAVTNSISTPVDPSIKTENRVDLTCTIVNCDKPCETPVFSPPESGMSGQSFGDLHLGKDDNQAELRNSGDYTYLGKILNTDLSNEKTCHDEVVSLDSEKVTTASDITNTNGIQEKQCQVAGTQLVDNEVRERCQEARVSTGGDLSLLSMKEDTILHNRKRKVGTELDCLDSGISESFHDSTLTISFPAKDSNIPIEELSSPVSNSPCGITESNFLRGNGLIDSCLKGNTCIDRGRDSNPIGSPSSYGKKRKITLFESVFSDKSVFENCALPTSADTLMSLSEVVNLHPVKSLTQLAEEIGLSETIIIDKNLASGAINNSHTIKYSFADSSKADSLCIDPYLSLKERASPDKKENGNFVMAGFTEGSESIALGSEGRMGTNDREGGVHSMGADHDGHSDHRSLVSDMECKNNIAITRNLPSLTNYAQLCAEFSDGGVSTNSDTLDTLSNVGDEKSSEHVGMHGSLSSNSNSLVNNEMKLKTGVTQKTVLLPSLNTKNTIASSNTKNRQPIRQNVLTRADASTSSSRSSVITPSHKKLPTYPAKPRTWHRTDNLPPSSILVKKPSVGSSPPQRPPFGRPVKVQATSYIRKGNSLVRNPASGAPTMGPRVLGASVDQSKPNDTNRIKKTMGSPGIIDSTMTGGRNTPIEMPKTPPLPSCGKSANYNSLYLGDCRTSLLLDQSEGIDNEEALKSSEIVLNSCRNSESAVDTSLEGPSSSSDGNLQASNSKRMVYIKRKSNQLIAAKDPSEASMHHVEKAPAFQSDNGYFKKRKNQLIRASSESNIQQMIAVIDDSSKLRPQRTLNVNSRRSSTKKQSKKVKARKVSLVWKLGDTKSPGKGLDPLTCGKTLADLLPWKRPTYWKSVWKSSSNFSSNCLLKTQKLPSFRKRAVVYVRSGRGFSLRRSKVISLAGSSLKWSKSMERRSKKVNEEASLSVASMDSVEMQKAVASEKQEKIARKTYVPKRRLIGSNEYFRIGNGNQLVRDPKKRTRVLASEKVRWSLHTARMRLAKKRKFCQFFTRFGRCNKGEGKCPYIHDPSKIAVCTKFLNGLCADSNCKLTHKVIPERMPDCSFFLQGLCSNENCPYRHVNVNPKASVCESFLRGYCAEGNECQKKHSYTCPEFEATGSCPQGSKCKLYHPKKGNGKKRKSSKDQKNAKGRYFGSGLQIVAKAEKHVVPKNESFAIDGELGDFISLDARDEEVVDNDDPTNEPITLSEDDPLDSELDDIDELIKPVRILDRI